MEKGYNGYLYHLERKLRGEFEDILRQEEIYWMQRYKGQFIVEGERNTRYYHQAATFRKGKNKMGNLVRDDGSIMDDIGEVQAHVQEHFKQLFCATDMYMGLPINIPAGPRLNDDDYHTLALPI